MIPQFFSNDTIASHSGSLSVFDPGDPWRFVDTATTRSVYVDGLFAQPAGSAAEVFGQSSALNPDVMLRSDEVLSCVAVTHAEGYPWYMTLFFLAISCFYFYYIWRFRGEMLAGFRSSFSQQRLEASFESRSIEQMHYLRYSRLLIAVNLALVALSLIRYDVFADSGMMIPSDLFFILALSGLCLVGMYRYLAIKVCGWFTEDSTLLERLSFLNKLNFAIVSVVFTPVAIAMVLDRGVVFIGLAILCLLTMYHLLRIIYYFIVCRFGLLQWILYLCAVEIFPLSLLLVLASRYNEI